MPKKRRSKPSLPSNLDEFDTGLHAESDRGAALLAAALLDAQLEALFRARLSHHQDRLLGFDGPIASFSTRIKMARALSWIDADLEHDLDVVRNIRNKFAHSFEQDLAFDESEVRGWCTSLLVVQAYLAGFDSAKEHMHRTYSLELIAGWRAIFDPPRMRYLAATNWLAQHLKEMVDGSWNGDSLISQVTSLGKGLAGRREATAALGAPIRGPAPDA